MLKKSVFDRTFCRVALKKVFQVQYIEFPRLPLDLGLIGLSQKRFISRKKNFRGGGARYQFRSQRLKLFQLGPIMKFQLPKTIASPLPEFPKKKKKMCWYNVGTFCQRQKSGSTEPFVAFAETRLGQI